MRLETYQDRFPFVRLRREDGVLEMTLHRDGGSAKWDFGPTGIHAQLGELFYAVSQDLDNRVVILTGAGEVFLTELDHGAPPAEAAGSTTPASSKPTTIPVRDDIRPA